MKARKKDVERMAAALAATVDSMQRASRKPDSARLRALYAVASLPGSTPRQLSEALSLHASSVTRQLQALAANGLVELTADQRDRRSCRVSLTRAGEKEITRLQETGVERFSLFVAKWDVKEVDELTRLLEKLEASKAAIAVKEQKKQAEKAVKQWRS